MYSIAERLERSLGRHRIQDAVDGFVASNAQNGGAQNLLALLINHHFHETLRLAFLDGARDAGHGPAANPDLVICCAGLRLRHADASEWRIDEQAITGDSVAD